MQPKVVRKVLQHTKYTATNNGNISLVRNLQYVPHDRIPIKHTAGSGRFVRVLRVVYGIGQFEDGTKGTSHAPWNRTGL